MLHAMRTRTTTNGSPLQGIWAILLIAFVVTALYFGRAVFVPLALATLITFLLSRLVNRLERWIGRIAAVLLVVIILFSVIGATSWMVGRQVIDLAEKLPDYQTNITRKLESVRLPAIGLFSRFSSSVNALQTELASPSPAPQPSGAEAPVKSTAPQARPVPVRVIEGQNAIPQLLQEGISAVLSPLGTAALVLLLSIFMLLKREDLRGRMIRLIGQGRISATTRAMEDAGARVSRYLSMQFLVNTCYGSLVALGLHSIGVPNAALWGLLAGILRFVPYVGPWVGAALPVLLSFAISSNWVTPILTIALFVGLEAVIANAVEPWLYGASTGVSPVALIVSAMFWTWLWGPVGLVLSTPLTVCLTVIGRHSPRLEFLSILLSEDQALAPHEEFYHRLLAVGTEGAEDFAENYATEHSVTSLYDEVVIPGVSRAEIDAQSGGLNAEQRTAALQRVNEIVEDLGLRVPQESTADDRKLAESTGLAPAVAGSRVLCVPATAYRDEIAGKMLAQLLVRHGFEAKNVAARLKPEELMKEAIEFKPESIAISVVSPSTLTEARHLGTSFREQIPAVKILVGAWRATGNLTNAIERLRTAGINEVVVSLAEAIVQLTKMTAPLADEMMAAPKLANEEERLEELNGLKILDTPVEKNFDRLTDRLTRLFKVPIALVTLIDKDRQWFKSQVGLPADLAEARGTPRDVSVCGHVVARNEILVVRDLARDPRFANNPFLKERGFRFYAGVPLRGPNGLPIGSLCILDIKPREMSAQEQQLLQIVAEDAMEEIKRRPVGNGRATVANEKA
jgi:predicted PurR-regulated permease PerM/methylmalonyl-CoA mutase cobalamin-binding subunit